ncbi:MAG: Crp/Fnr family transcriptional regulator [Alcaligenaceae bacterium]|nr:Crp/Fnr family transcriptional regulator [Alcaligenaceae bacterium]
MQIDSSSAGGRAARVRAHLSGVPLFKELSAQEMDPIVGGTTEIPVARGDIIFRRGDSCTGFHIVVSGQVKLILVSPEGVEKVVRLVGPGDSFGEALMFMGKDYIVTSQALADTLLLHVGRDVLFEQIERQPVLARRMLAGLSRRLHALMGDVETYSMRSGVQRVIGYLLKDPDVRAGIPFRLETGKSVIASRLSITPEHFSRILRELNDRGLIRMRGREITVGDLDALASYRG